VASSNACRAATAGHGEGTARKQQKRAHQNGEDAGSYQHHNISEKNNIMLARYRQPGFGCSSSTQAAKKEHSRMVDRTCRCRRSTSF